MKFFLGKTLLIFFLFLANVAYGEMVPIKDSYSIREINAKNLTFGTYRTDGFVVKKYQCPSCDLPRGCLPCEPAHIVISEKEWILFPGHDLTENELVLVVEDVQAFELGARYQMLIQILDVNSLRGPTNNIKLIYFEKLNE